MEAARALAEPGLGPAGGVFRRLLVAYDGSESAQQAFGHAVRLAWAGDGHLTVLTVAGSDEDGSESVLDGAVAGVPLNVEVASLLRRGSAVEEILLEAGSGDYDLLVMGYSRDGESITHQVLQAARLPVLVVRHGSR
jgi:nucleotide-binding universal stress UspA family protein